MPSLNFRQLIDHYKLISDQVDTQELIVILSELEKSLTVEGAVVEFGCFTGTTSLYIQRVLDLRRDARAFHVYDSFEGLPPKSSQDESPLGIQFQEGELLASKKQFIREFHKADLRLPVIHKQWFDQLTIDELPASIAFAFLDGDYYESIKVSLELIAAHLVEDATIVVDDYANDALPGAKRAVDAWCHQQGQSLQVSHSLALIHYRRHTTFRKAGS